MLLLLDPPPKRCKRDAPHIQSQTVVGFKQANETERHIASPRRGERVANSFDKKLDIAIKVPPFVESNSCQKCHGMYEIARNILCLHRAYADVPSREIITIQAGQCGNSSEWS